MAIPKRHLSRTSGRLPAQKTPLFKCKPGDEHHVVGAALMLAERFVKDEPHTAELWDIVTEIPEPRMIIMQRRFHEETDVLMETLFNCDEDLSDISDALNDLFERHSEFRDPALHSLLPWIRGWHRLSSDTGSGWYSWN